MTEITRIAIVDDHKLVRTGISLILKSHSGFQVVLEAENGREFLEKIERGKVDIVLLDMEMPVLSGQETLIELRKQYPDLPVLILTMHNNKAYILQMMEIGANGYLLKDNEPKEVIEAIVKVRKTGYYFSDSVSIAMLQGIADSNVKISSATLNTELTAREVDVLRLICEELTSIEIGERLFVSPKTVEGYRKVLMDKTGARNMAGLVLYAVEHKVIG